MTPRLSPVDPAKASGKARELLDAVQRKLGITPNMMRTMANSPAVLDAYLSFAGALARGALSAKNSEQIALAVASANDCGYCAAAHTALGKMSGLSPEQISSARRGQSNDPKTNATLRLARQIVTTRGQISDADLASARSAGLSDGEIAEVVAHTALNIFTNYFNRLAATEIDFPPVEMIHQ